MSRTTAALPMPGRDDFRSPDETIVHAPPNRDDWGRCMFTAFWLDSYLPPDGVRGQVFFTSPDEFAARCPGPVRVVEVGQGLTGEDRALCAEEARMKRLEDV